jgi:hypothetical protein
MVRNMDAMSIRISAYTVRADGTQTEPRTLYEGEGGEPRYWPDATVPVPQVQGWAT